MDFERTKETSQWRAGSVFNTDDLDFHQPVNDTDDNIHLDNRQVAQRRRWQRVHRVQDKYAQKQLSKEMPMPETKKRTKAAEWLQRLDKKDKGDSIDEGWKKKTAIAAGGLDLLYGAPVSGAVAKTGWKYGVKPAGKFVGGRLAELPGISHGIEAGKYIASAPGRAVSSIGRGIESTTSAIGSGIGATKAALASTVPATPTVGAYGAKVLLPGAIGYSIGALIGTLTRAALNMKYTVNKEKLRQVTHIPRTTEPEDISGALDWFGFYEMGAMVRSGQGDPTVALQNILRALDGNNSYINPITGRKMTVSTKIPMYNMGKKCLAIADLTSTIRSAHEHLKEFDFTFMVQERFKWNSLEDYNLAHINEEILTIALMVLASTLGTIQFGKFHSLLRGIDKKVSQLMGARTETEALKLVAGIVDAFGFKTGKLVINKKADPLIALDNVLDYLEGRNRTRNASTGYKVATPIKSFSMIPFGASRGAVELLGYIEEINELIKRLGR